MTLSRTIWHAMADADWKSLAPSDAEAILALPLQDGLHEKQGRSIAKWRLNDRLAVYLKRHFRESRIKGWLATLTGRPGWSSAWQEFHRIRWAASEGFRVPRAVAVGEGVGPRGRLRGYLAVEDLTGMSPLHELIPKAFAQLPCHTFEAWKRGLVGELARMARELHGRRYFHKDLYLCHFFAEERMIAHSPREWRDQLAMIDLHRLARHRLTWRWWQLKDLAQLLYSSEVPGVSARDRLRFWRLYAGPNRRRGIGRWMRRLILVRWHNYRDHNSPRPAA